MNDNLVGVSTSYICTTSGVKPLLRLAEESKSFRLYGLKAGSLCHLLACAFSLLLNDDNL